MMMMMMMKLGCGTGRQCKEEYLDPSYSIYHPLRSVFFLYNIQHCAQNSMHTSNEQILGTVAESRSLLETL